MLTRKAHSCIRRPEGSIPVWTAGPQKYIPVSQGPPLRGSKEETDVSRRTLLQHGTNAHIVSPTAVLRCQVNCCSMWPQQLLHHRGNCSITELTVASQERTQWKLTRNTDFVQNHSPVHSFTMPYIERTLFLTQWWAGNSQSKHYWSSLSFCIITDSIRVAQQ